VNHRLPQRRISKAALGRQARAILARSVANVTPTDRHSLY